MTSPVELKGNTYSPIEFGPKPHAVTRTSLFLLDPYKVQTLSKIVACNNQSGHHFSKGHPKLQNKRGGGIAIT